MRIASGIFDSSSLPTHSFLLGFPSYFIHRDLGLVYSISFSLQPRTFFFHHVLL
jgi:hypothetical protein